MRDRHTPTGLEAFETASPEELASLQLEQMQRSLRHAHGKVPVYRKKFDRHGVHPDDLRRLAFLRHFPFTTKPALGY